MLVDATYIIVFGCIKYRIIPQDRKYLVKKLILVDPQPALNSRRKLKETDEPWIFPTQTCYRCDMSLSSRCFDTVKFSWT
jgi:hypothetical protein